MIYDNKKENIDLVAPVEDHVYNNLQIPIFLIKNQDGLKIKEFIEKNNDVMISIDLEILTEP